MAMSSVILPVVVCVFAWYIYSRSVNQKSPYITKLNNTYDYIVVGAGSAGAVVAARLSEDPDVHVLLVEAGPAQEDSPSVAVPGLAGNLEHSNENWAYLTEPQKHACFAMHEHRGYCPRGKVIGGTSSTNYMVYVRGSRHDYDGWAADGCDGWSYKDVLPYFIKSEGVAIEELKDSKYHGKDGPLHVSLPRETPMQDLYLRAAQELGYTLTDINGEDQIGVGWMQATIKHGVRWNTNEAFLKPAHDRSNLHISVNTMAIKVVIENNQAVGVDVIRNGRKIRVNAAKEVIVSGGVFNSPQLLMLSGVGPRKHLENLRIEVKADLPVGEGLQHHLTVSVPLQLNTTGYTFNADVPPFWTQLKYMLFGTGFLSVSVTEGLFFAYKENEPKQDDGRAPDIEFEFLSINHFSPDVKDAFEYNFAKDVKDKIYTSDKSKEAMTFIPLLLHPKSTGTVRLRSRDPFDHPLIDPHYLEHPDDVKAMVQAMRIVEKFVDTNVLRGIGMSMDNPSPVNQLCAQHKFRSDAFWECFVRLYTLSGYHDSSTCRMGAHDDPTAVVDPQLRVIGIKGLRVADASVMRDVPSGNTNAPAIMIGEKAADLIKGIGLPNRHQ